MEDDLSTPWQRVSFMLKLLFAAVVMFAAAALLLHLMQGHLATGQMSFRRSTITRSGNPIQFWLGMGLTLAFALGVLAGSLLTLRGLWLPRDKQLQMIASAPQFFRKTRPGILAAFWIVVLLVFLAWLQW